jgi:hypothetical protein
MVIYRIIVVPINQGSQLPRLLSTNVVSIIKKEQFTEIEMLDMVNYVFSLPLTSCVEKNKKSILLIIFFSIRLCGNDKMLEKRLTEPK